MLKKCVVFCFFLFMTYFVNADIAFISNRGGKSDIYIMNDDGTYVRRVTDIPFRIGNLAWSPDGNQIAFSADVNSGEPGNPQQLPQQYDIHIINVDGTRLQNLTEHPSIDGSPAWAPDGRHLTFASGREKPVSLDIYIMDLVTSKVWQLTRLGFASSPDWSPDGKKIVYEFVKVGEGRSIYTMNTDGRNARPLLKQPRKGQFGAAGILSVFPRWSPDGKYVLYNEMEFGLKGRIANSILIVNADTQHISLLNTPKGWLIDSVCWMDGGDAVLFSAVPKALISVVPKIFKIYKYDLATKQIMNLTNHPSDNWGMDWTPHRNLAVSSAEKLATKWAQLKVF